MSWTAPQEPRDWARLGLFRGFALVAMTVAASGCVGPASIHLSRVHYNKSVHQTNDEELLLNLVRLRYSEGVTWMRVTGVNTQYEASALGESVSGTDQELHTRLLTGRLSFADRPTITFDPRRSSEFTRALITRLDPNTMQILDAAGWDPDRLYRVFVEQVNGVPNALGSGRPIPCDPPEFAEFRHASRLLSHLRESRHVVLRTEKVFEEAPSTVPLDRIDARELLEAQKSGYGVRPIKGDGLQLTLSRQRQVMLVDPVARQSQDWLEFARLVRIDPDQERYEYRVEASGQFLPNDPSQLLPEITISTRSILEAMYYLSHAICVPDDHVKNGIVAVTRYPDGTPFNWLQVTGDILRVEVSRLPPKCAAVKVKHRGHWFYIPRDDVASRTTLSLMQEVIRLQRLESGDNSPTLTLPVGR
ncbi:MAG: hypothetical protein IT428_17010 [Planctomycetaceae bacterium]|nr:hypothetical protein [Planctomycetaceae bacterium]